MMGFEQDFSSSDDSEDEDESKFMDAVYDEAETQAKFS